MSLHGYLDHVVIAVPDLEDAQARWAAAGLATSTGGEHPGGTHNRLVRGPERAYVELLAAQEHGTSPWWERVRSAHGPLAWAIGVTDIDEARSQLIARGIAPQRVVEGSRTTPDGSRLSWRVCDIAPAPMDPHLPFLIQWREGMPPGPADGPALTEVTISVPDPARVATILAALGLPAADGEEHAFDDGEVRVRLVAGDAGPSRLTVDLGPDDDEECGEAALDALEPQTLDGVEVTRA